MQRSGEMLNKISLYKCITYTDWHWQDCIMDSLQPRGYIYFCKPC